MNSLSTLGPDSEDPQNIISFKANLSPEDLQKPAQFVQNGNFLITIAGTEFTLTEAEYGCMWPNMSNNDAIEMLISSRHPNPENSRLFPAREEVIRGYRALYEVGLNTPDKRG